MENYEDLMLEFIIDEFDFHVSTLWNGGVVLFILFFIILYIFILPSGKNHTVWKTVIFFAGLIALFIALGSPINIVARIKYSSHIIQLIFLLLVAPPLLIYGFKKEIIERAREIEWIDQTIRILTKPVNALILFFVLFYIYHVPFVFDFVRIDLFLNYLFFFLLFGAAILLWIPILSEKSKLTGNQKMLYALVNIVLFIPYSLILFTANEGLYLLYTDTEMFRSSVELCLPNEEDVPPEFYQALIPYDPVQQQVEGGKVLLIWQVIIILGYTLWGLRIGKKAK
jgi:putative membrane protein